MITYDVTVTAVGELTVDFAEAGILVFFGDQAPEELHDFAVLHTHGELLAPVEPGDRIEIEGASFPVLCVGDVANGNIEALGHLVLKFNGRTEPELPGDVSVPEGPAPLPQVGSTVRIIRGEH